MKCDTCGENFKENGVGCDWRQGRCPHRLPILTDYHFRYLNLIQWVRELFKNKLR
jgi:hypothetical protein